MVRIVLNFDTFSPNISIINSSLTLHKFITNLQKKSTSSIKGYSKGARGLSV